MSKIKVLVVDDSAVIRKLLGDLISEDPELEVVGTAANGKLALEQIQQVQPDIVTLDIEMPEMDGLETVRQIRKQGSQIPIIMCSSLTASGASYTLDALASGASDYVTKPSSHGINTREVVGAELLRKIKGLAAAAHASSTTPVAQNLSAAANSRIITEASPLNPSVGAIAVGVSTGGPNALNSLLSLLPKKLPMSIFIVQHMPPVFTKLLAERLSAVSGIPVLEGEHDQEVKPGQIYLAPGGFHMEVKRVLNRVLIRLNEGPPENSCRPAVDVLFRSIASVYGKSATALLLTGMGQDGLKGSHYIKEAGGTIIAQDRETSAVWGMPGAVVEAGLASAVLPIPQIVTHLFA